RDQARQAHDRRSRRDRRRRDARGLPARLGLAASEPEEAGVVDVQIRLLCHCEPATEEADALDVLSRSHVERLLVERHRVLLGPAALGLLGRGDEVLSRMLELAGAAPVARERRSGLADLGRRLLDELRDVAVVLASPGAWLKVVRDVADEDVLERPLHVSLDPRRGLTVDQVPTLEG